jgi:citrate lyase subunit beta/citryl-CoA lyase
VAVVREAFRPPADRLAWADEVLSSAAAAGGVAMVGGSMVDEPVLRAARRVRELAGVRQA